MTKATASRRLAALEEALGARLVERKPNGLELTLAGREVVSAADSIQGTIASLEAKVAAAADDKPRGTVRLTAPQWLASRLLVPALPELKSSFPELEVLLVGTNEVLNLAQREADLALRNVPPSHQSLVSRKVMELGGCVYASKLYIERRGIPAGRDSLRGHDILAYGTLGGMPGFEWLRDSDDHGGSIAFRANDPESLVSAATAGLGLAAVPCLLGDAESSLIRVPSLGFSRCDMFLVTHEQIRSTPRIVAVSRFVVDLLNRHRRLIEG